MIAIDHEEILNAKIKELEKKVKEHQKEAEDLRRLAVVVRDSNDAITVQDREGNIISWNKGAELMYGYTEAEAKAMNIKTIIPDEYLKESQKFSKKIFLGEIAPSFESKRMTKSGKIIDVWLTATVLTNENGNPKFMSTTERDITEKNNAIKTIKTQAEELKRANEELEQFAFIAAHDVKAPLRSIRTLAQMLNTDYGKKLDDTGREYLSYLITSTNHMNAIVEDLLTYSRINDKKSLITDVDCHKNLQVVLSNLRSDIEDKGAVISYSTLPVIRGNELQILQLFQNLLGNAIKFTKEKSPEIKIDAVKKGTEWIFSVADNGIGIAKENFQKIYEAFKRLHTQEEFPGTGIGLAICKKVVEQHGGKIWVESTPGKGSVFYFSLPA